MGWTSIDRALFDYFVYDDRGRFGVQPLRIAASSTRHIRLPFEWTSFLERVMLPYPMLSLAALIVIAIHLHRRDWTVVASAGLMAVISIGAMTWLHLTSRLPERVALPSWLSIVLLGSIARLRPQASELAGSVAPVFARRSRTSQLWRRAPGIVLTTALVPIWLSPIGPAASWRVNRERKSSLNSQVEMVGRAFPKVILASGAAMTTEATDPLQSVGLYRNERILPFGWPTFSPPFETRKANLGIHDSLRDILTRDELLWLSTADVTLAYQSFLISESPATGTLLKFIPQQCSEPEGPCTWKLTSE